MTRFARSALWLSAAAMLAMPARTALAADPVTFFQWSGCGGTVFNTCVDVTISKGTYMLDDVSQELIKMEVKNLGSLGSNSYGSVFTALGVRNIPYHLTGLVGSSGFGSGWTFSQGITELNNFGTGFEGVNINGNTGIAAGEYATFYFTFDIPSYVPVPYNCRTVRGVQRCKYAYPGAPVGWAEGRPMEFALHGQRGPNDCSTKLRVVQTEVGTAAAGDETYDQTIVNTASGTTIGCEGPHSVVPEPATLFLAGTGLAGLIGLARLRRGRGA